MKEETKGFCTKLTIRRARQPCIRYQKTRRNSSTRPQKIATLDTMPLSFCYQKTCFLIIAWALIKIGERHSVSALLDGNGALPWVNIVQVQFRAWLLRSVNKSKDEFMPMMTRIGGDISLMALNSKKRARNTTIFLIAPPQYTQHQYSGQQNRSISCLAQLENNFFYLYHIVLVRKCRDVEKISLIIDWKFSTQTSTSSE